MLNTSSFVSWNLYALAFPLVAGAATTFAALHYIHMLQLESYQGNMYISWIRRGGKKEILSCALCGLIPLLLHIGWVFFYYSSSAIATALEYGSDAVYVLLMAYIGFTNNRKDAKKPLAFTGRIWRLIAVFAAVSIVFHFSFFLNLPPNTWGNILLMLVLRYLPGMLLPLFLLIPFFITLPVENGIKKWYFNDAKKKLAKHPGLIKIGITGSYGKTSTKFILGTILQEKMETLVTPGSYNTPMGVTRVIREQLHDAHQAFIAEMGARYKGDIRELCELVQPRYGILTSVGKQHLETFGSYEAVLETKAELIAALPEDGAAFLNGDQPDCAALAKFSSAKDTLFFGLDGEGLYMQAVDITVGKTGSSFTLIAADGQSAACHTVLLGKHNIGNITAAAAMAKYLGLSMEEIAAGIQKIKPVHHRLQLIEGVVTVIDDAFNANPAGAKAALEVLRAFAPERRIIVTPGMIELGEEEETLNEEFGKGIAGAADIAILVGGERVESIRRGLLAEGFDPACVVQVDTLDQASEKLPMYTSPGCVVLFENDLPDNYDKA